MHGTFPVAQNAYKIFMHARIINTRMIFYDIQIKRIYNNNDNESALDCVVRIYIYTHTILNMKEPRNTKRHVLVSLPGAGDDIEKRTEII